MGGGVVIARLVALVEDATERFLSAVVDRLIAAWIEAEE